MKGVVADKTFVILDSAVAISPINHYIEIVKDESGRKFKKKHTFFNVLFKGEEVIRFERLRDGLKPNRDTNYPHTLIVYSDISITEMRENIVKLFNS